MKVYINGKYYDKDDAKVSVFDHGFLYGDGIFEGIRLYDGNVFKLDKHIDRLFRSAKAIMLDMPWSKRQIIDAVCDACRTNGLKDGYIRLVVSRGKGKLGLSPFSCEDPQLVIIADEIQLYPKELYECGLKALTVPTRRNSQAALPPMVKSLNYLNNILAKSRRTIRATRNASFSTTKGMSPNAAGTTYSSSSTASSSPRPSAAARSAA